MCVFHIKATFNIENQIMKILLSVLLATCSLSVFAQNKSRENHFRKYEFARVTPSAKIQLENFDQGTAMAVKKSQRTIFVIGPEEIPFTGSGPFIAFSCRWMDPIKPTEENTELYISFSPDGFIWSELKKIKIDEHGSDTGTTAYSQLMFERKEYRYFHMVITSNKKRQGKVIQSLYLNFFNPGKQEAAAPEPVSNQALNGRSAPDNPATCPCALPAYTTRTQWNCPQGQDPPPGVGYSAAVTHLVVHHSAGNNTATDWNSVVLSIWNQHVFTNGYSDIGYNWLVAPNGVLYEGRGGGNNVTGAHFCGFNTGTMGTCMMGTYTSTDVTSAARSKLIDILAYKACNSSINPLGSSNHPASGLTLNNISGHRDGCATECPGTTFYNTFPSLRTDVNNFITACVPCPAPVGAIITANPANATICAPDSVQLTASATNCSSCTYTWNNGQTGAVIYAKTSGTYTVTISSSCGTVTAVKTVAITPSVAPSLTITYSGCPATTLDFQAGNIQNAGNGPLFQWYVNNVLAGATNNFTLVNAVNGTKVFCRLTSNANCANPPSVSSDTLTVNCIATPVVEIDGLEYFYISPNPNNGVFNIQLKLNSVKQMQYRLLDVNGNTIFQSLKEKTIGVILRKIAAKKMVAGLYFVELVLDNKRIQRKVVVH
jgi:hypothetical protein